MILSIGSHSLDAQRQWTVYTTPVLRKGSEIDVVTIPDESAANDHAMSSSVILLVFGLPAFVRSYPEVGSQDSRNPTIPWLTNATLTHSRMSVIVKLNFRTSIVLTRRTPNQLDAIANGKKIMVVFS